MYRMPAEWEPHELVEIRWPFEGMWRGYEMKLEPIWLQIVQALVDHNVRILVGLQDDSHLSHVAEQLRYYGFHDVETEIEVFHVPADDIWARDVNPTYVVRDVRGGGRELFAVCWTFNGYGARYEVVNDGDVARVTASHSKIPWVKESLVTEGGNIEVNGSGDMLVVRSAVLNPNRNPGMSQRDVELMFRRYLGVQNVVWLSGMQTGDYHATGIGDDIDIHVDSVARFVNEDTIVYAWTEDANDPEYSMLVQHRQELEKATLVSGKKPILVPLPCPEGGVWSTSKIGEGGMILQHDHSLRAPASYTNFLITNGAVLVPVYGNRNDQRALDILREQFPGRDVVGILATALVENGGAIHCVTQQRPAVTQ